MNEIRRLEHQWSKYRTRKIISVMIYTSSLYAVAISGYYIFLNLDSIHNFFSKKVIPKESNISIVESRDKNISIEESNISRIESEDKNISIEESSEKENITDEIAFLKPIIPIIDMEKERASTKKYVVHKAKKHSNRVKAKPSTYLTSAELSKSKRSNHEERDTTKLKSINMHSSSKNYIETMKKKFLKNRTPREALLLAKVFYREKNYKESEKWALEANKLDSNLDESWIIFAKTKVKMGKKREAVKILAMYYKKSKSHKVLAMIEKIKTGKL